ncbi:HD domain-containing protein [Stenotrophomonas cyclobalanopsidis]|uniref:HD domain-containing protein n=1 Tax=Stenotrophomonas cyclobalanopsidis TaxID=2771362 RepID=UPI002FD9D4DB
MTVDTSKTIKDPIHGAVKFEGAAELELKNLLSDPYFQRLRRVKQLGFSDHVFPSATHSRFAHSLGVYGVAKRLLSVVEPGVRNGNWSRKGKACLAAALLHDVGHGMFSHAFENAMKMYIASRPKVDPKFKDAVSHEKLSRRIVTETSVSDVLKRIGGQGFPDEVAAMIEKQDTGCIYTSIVSSQLDADRLDYAKRDPYFAGVSSGGIDLDWLVDHLRVRKTSDGRFFYVDGKALVAIEQFMVTLFQLYPTLYLHHRTRAFEYMFSKLMVTVFELIADGRASEAGLEDRHPLVLFFNDPGNLEYAKVLDDSLFWGSLHLFQKAPDPVVSTIAGRFAARMAYPRIDVWAAAERIAVKHGTYLALPAAERAEVLHRACEAVCTHIQKDEKVWHASCHYDSYRRQIYKAENIAGGYPQQINVQHGGDIVDIASVSPIVASAASFTIHRIYFDDEVADLDKRLKTAISRSLRVAIKREIATVRASPA